MDIKKICQINIFLILIYFTLPGFAQQYKMPVDLPICKDIKIIVNELPELPTTDYPAKHYTNDQLIERMVALANDPLITPRDLEVEFGLKFFECIRSYPHIINDKPTHVYYSKGQFPLGGSPKKTIISGNQTPQRNSVDVTYIRFSSGGHSIFINFNQKANEAKISNIIDCVYRKQVIKTLDKEWVEFETGNPYHIWHEKINKLNKQRLILTHQYITLPYCINEGGIDYLSISFSPIK